MIRLHRIRDAIFLWGIILIGNVSFVFAVLKSFALLHVDLGSECNVANLDITEPLKQRFYAPGVHPKLLCAFANCQPTARQKLKSVLGLLGAPCRTRIRICYRPL